jgi:hypothetical protein
MGLFRDLTLTLLPWNWFDRDVELMWMLKRTPQMPHRDPRSFDIYIQVNEEELDR